MTTPDGDMTSRSMLVGLAYRFFWGAIIGLGFSLIPLAISMPMANFWAIAAALAVLCGTLSALIGKQFLSVLMNVLESFPPIA